MKTVVIGAVPSRGGNIRARAPRVARISCPPWKKRGPVDGQGGQGRQCAAAGAARGGRGGGRGGAADGKKRSKRSDKGGG